MRRDNLTMLSDFYQLTMANGYFEHGYADKIVYFDLFFRKIPECGGFAIMAGLEQVIDYLKNLKFTDDDIEFLRAKKCFSEGFLEYLRNFKFACDVWAIPEGTPIFPMEPLITVRGPALQAQYIETMLLLCINHQSLIATKANRIVRAAAGRPVMEFGSRRAQGADGAIYGARAAYIGGCIGTACTIVDREEGNPGAWDDGAPVGCSFLIRRKRLSAVTPRLIRVTARFWWIRIMFWSQASPMRLKIFNQVIVPLGFRPKGVRIDSGDIAYLSKKARAMLG